MGITKVITTTAKTVIENTPVKKFLKSLLKQGIIWPSTK